MPRLPALAPVDKAQGPRVFPGVSIDLSMRIERRDEIIIGADLRLLRARRANKPDLGELRAV
jgi:hypothetical protein